MRGKGDAADDEADHHDADAWSRRPSSCRGRFLRECIGSIWVLVLAMVGYSCSPRANRDSSRQISCFHSAILYGDGMPCCDSAVRALVGGIVPAGERVPAGDLIDLALVAALRRPAGTRAAASRGVLARPRPVPRPASRQQQRRCPRAASARQHRRPRARWSGRSHRRTEFSPVASPTLVAAASTGSASTDDGGAGDDAGRRPAAGSRR